MAEHPAEQIQLSPEDLDLVVEEAARCGKSPSEVVHEALQLLRAAQPSEPPTWSDPVPFAQRMREWDEDPDGGGFPDGDPIWRTVGIGASTDGATDVSANKKLYLYGPDIAQTS